MLDESKQQGMDPYAIEPNVFVDRVLEIVYRLCGKRNIVFSSFHPDICLLLSFKQPSIPVLFLTDAGCSPAQDIRAGSLKQAIRFASQWDLLGIVTAVEPLLHCPRLVRVIKESGLVCASYGTMNNEKVHVQVVSALCLPYPATLPPSSVSRLSVLARRYADERSFRSFGNMHPLSHPSLDINPEMRSSFCSL